jgi:hypothetical protein
MEHQFAENEVSYKPSIPITSLPVISSTEQAYETLMKIWDQNTIFYREEFERIYHSRYLLHKIKAP